MAASRDQLALSFTSPRAPEVYSVSALAHGLRALVESHFDDVEVEGELSNFKRAHSGHCYFTLKDAEAQLQCVMWRGFAEHVFFQPRDGMLIRAKGSTSVYERRGALQLVVRSVRLAGEGALQRAFEQLKRTLAAEGLFDEAGKQPLPPYPETIGVVTSGTGAALHDILSILQRRFPQVQVVLCPVPVQGLGAAEAIAAAIDHVNALTGHAAPSVPAPDVLIVGRGGGSAEDLWAFNEEAVARSIFASRIPVVSAVGHETDVSISDYVADERAATPSMAAELVVPDGREVAAYIDVLHEDLHAVLQLQLAAGHQRLARLTQSYGFHRVPERLAQQQDRLDVLARRLARDQQHRLAKAAQQVEALRRQLRSLDPERPLRQGYAKVERAGSAVTRAAHLAAEDQVVLKFLDGEHQARIEA